MGPLFKNKKNMEANTDPFHFITVTELMLGLAAPKSWMGTERGGEKNLEWFSSFLTITSLVAGFMALGLNEKGRLGSGTWEQY